MLKLKGCPKCREGDITFDRDHYGWYEYCLQCGYMGDLVHIEELAQEQAGGTKESRQADSKRPPH